MNELVLKLKVWYGKLQQREQRIVAVGAVALALLVLIGGFLLPLATAASRAADRAQTKRADLAWMRENAPEIQAAGPALPGASGEAAVVIVDRTAREAGLGTALRGSQPSGSGVRVQLEAAPFDTLITWLATLDQQYGVAIDSITIDRAAKPGTISANVTFAPPRR